MSDHARKPDVNDAGASAYRDDQSMIFDLFLTEGSYDPWREVALGYDTRLTEHDNAYTRFRGQLKTDRGKRALDTLLMDDLISNLIRGMFISWRGGAARTSLMQLARNAHGGYLSATQQAPGEGTLVNENQLMWRDHRDDASLSDVVSRAFRIRYILEKAEEGATRLMSDHEQQGLQLQEVRSELDVAYSVIDVLQMGVQYLGDFMHDWNSINEAIGTVVRGEAGQRLRKTVDVDRLPSVARTVVTTDPYTLSEDFRNVAPRVDPQDIATFATSDAYRVLRENLRTDHGRSILWWITEPSKSIVETLGAIEREYEDFGR